MSNQMITCRLDRIPDGQHNLDTICDVGDSYIVRMTDAMACMDYVARDEYGAWVAPVYQDTRPLYRVTPVIGSARNQGGA